MRKWQTIMWAAAVGLLASGGTERAAEAGIIHHEPSGIDETDRSQYLGWDQESDQTVVGQAGGSSIDFYLTDHGDLHFDSYETSVLTTASVSITAAKLQAGDPIGPDAFFSVPGWGFAWTTRSGQFDPSSSGFLGVRIRKAGLWHYGWAEVAFAGTRQAIRGWAYEDQPGVGLQAGQIAAQGLSVGAVPEPASFATLGLGALLTAVGSRRRRRRGGSMPT